MIERKGNYIDGTRMQMDYDEMLEMVQVAYMNKKNQLQKMLACSWHTDTYESDSYHQDTRGRHIARLGREFERIAVILHHLQALGESKDRQANFSWWLNKGSEEE
tara:strand:- start:572 stop:886 length:315 start_codon:yes stop_codon:yes gene_type:complete